MRDLVVSPEVRGAVFWSEMGAALSRGGKTGFFFTGCEVVAERGTGVLHAVTSFEVFSVIDDDVELELLLTRPGDDTAKKL